MLDREEAARKVGKPLRFFLLSARKGEKILDLPGLLC